MQTRQRSGGQSRRACCGPGRLPSLIEPAAQIRPGWGERAEAGRRLPSQVSASRRRRVKGALAMARLLRERAERVLIRRLARSLGRSVGGSVGRASRLALRGRRPRDGVERCSPPHPGPCPRSAEHTHSHTETNTALVIGSCATTDDDRYVPERKSVGDYSSRRGCLVKSPHWSQKSPISKEELPILSRRD